MKISKYIPSIKQWKKTMAAAGLMASVALPGVSHAFSEDTFDLSAHAHSSFHYELVRTLARASGFSMSDAEDIAMASQATDTMMCQTKIQHYVNEISIRGTERSSDVADFFHWPRRNAVNATATYTHPGNRDECRYFDGTDDSCSSQSEANQLELWAVYGQNTLTVPVPEVSINRGEWMPVEAGSLYALGIYLHGLGDSYSHEACMATAQTRSHHGSYLMPKECNPAFWHQLAEFGGGPAANHGVPYTIEAGMAVWKALKHYRQVNGLGGYAFWNDDIAKSFVSYFAQYGWARTRKDFAVYVFNQLR